MKELFISFKSNGFAISVLFAIVMIGVYKFYYSVRGKRQKRNFSLISRKLSDQGFGKWMFVDFLIYAGLAIGTGFAFHSFLNLIVNFFTPNDIIYQSAFRPLIISFSSMFFGISAPSFLWVKIAKLIHKKRYKQYLLYVMANQNTDLISQSKIILQPLCILFLVFGLLGTPVLETIRGDKLIERGLFSTSTTTHTLNQLEEFLITEKFFSPNGSTINKTRFILKFNDGYIWESTSLDGGFTQLEMNKIAEHILKNSKVQPRVVEFSPYD